MPNHQYRSAVHGGSQARTARSARGHDGGAAAPGPLSPRPGPAAKSPDRAAGDRPNQASQQKQKRTVDQSLVAADGATGGDRPRSSGEASEGDRR